LTNVSGHLSIWGDDDFGMEKDNVTREQFDLLCSKPITQIICRELGMINA